MFEEKKIRRVLIKNTFLFFAVFAILFTLLGVFVYQMVSSNIFYSADQQLSGAAVSSISVSVNEQDSSMGVAQSHSLTGEASNQDNRASDVLDLGVQGLYNDLGAYGSSLDATTYSDSLSADGFDFFVPLQTVEAAIEENPQILFLLRDTEGNFVDAHSIYADYPDFVRDLPFDATLLYSVYPLEHGEHQYRAINRPLYDEAGGTTIIQSLVNVDAEIAILDQFTMTLIVALLAALIACAVASYFLSKRTIRPIADAWKKQTEFIQNASHELRTPLTIIHATQELLLEKPQERIIDHFEDISLTMDEAKRLEHIAEDLLELSIADEVEENGAADTFLLDPFVEDTVATYQELADRQDKELELSLHYAGTIVTDKDKVRKLLDITLDNALKYTNEGDVITVSTHAEDDKVCITVCDTGIGVSEEDAERVFERFFRADKAHSRACEGRGLGLSIAQSLIGTLEGNISLAPNSPKGTRVTILLPRE